MKKKDAQKAYDEILRVLKKHEDHIVIDVDHIETQSKLHMFALELKEDYGINISHHSVHSLDYVELCKHVYIARYGKKQNREISWPDDGRQPDNELLLQIGFSTGAYMFGDDYPVDLFNKFWGELIAYNPKYKDSKNRNLYYSMDNAGAVYGAFPAILKKYKEINETDKKRRQIKRLQDELNKLSKQ